MEHGYFFKKLKIQASICQVERTPIIHQPFSTHNNNTQ
jgi:hypothetical protein